MKLSIRAVLMDVRTGFGGYARVRLGLLSEDGGGGGVDWVQVSVPIDYAAAMDLARRNEAIRDVAKRPRVTVTVDLEDEVAP